VNVTGFLANTAGHLNKFNHQLQGKDQLIHTLYDSITDFKTKLELWECWMKANNYFHFPSSVERNESEGYNSEKYSNCITTLWN
jgi:hypothetical protein